MGTRRVSAPPVAMDIDGDDDDMAGASREHPQPVEHECGDEEEVRTPPPPHIREWFKLPSYSANSTDPPIAMS